MYSPQQIVELTNIVDKFNLMFIVNNVGAEYLTPAELSLLQAYGFEVDLTKIGQLDYAYNFGMLAQALGDNRAKGMTFGQFTKFLSSGNFLPLSDVEKGALATVKHQAYKDIRGLGNKMKGGVHQIVIEGSKRNRKQYEKIIRDTLEETIKNRESQQFFASKLGEITKDWARDFDRIADYLMHDAYDRGRANSILREMGEDAEVYKDVFEGACISCIGLYTTDGIGSLPVIFKLKTLTENGTNIGRNSKEWKPVLGPTHPYCRCTLNHKPENTSWNFAERSFSIVERNTYGVKRGSKVNIKVG